MTIPLEGKMQRLERRLKARTKRDGKPQPGFEQNVAHIRAEMEIISGRIEFAKAQMEGNNG